MKKSNGIIPPIDLTNSREYYGMYNSRDFYKGTSFKFSGNWMPNTHYFNDEYIVDFVAYEGSLWACQYSHLSNNSTIPTLSSRFWVEVITGIEGKEGKAYIPKINPETGKLTFELSSNPTIEEVNVESLKGDKGNVYIPSSILQDGNIVFHNSSSLDLPEEVKISIASLKGDEGKTGKTPQLNNVTINWRESGEPIGAFIKTNIVDKEDNPYYDLTLTLPLDQLKGVQGDKGDKGDDAPTPSIKIEKVLHPEDPRADIVGLFWDPSGTGENWNLVGDIRGKSPKLIRVLSTIEDPDFQNETRRDDRILWGYDGIPVSEWTTLCYLDELRGDENIAYGCPSDFEDGAPSIDKIWYDPCDEAIDEFSINDFLYQAYLNVGGNLNKSDFENAFSNLSNVSGFEVKFASSLEDLGDPTKDKLGKIWLVPAVSSSEKNIFDEYIVVHSPNTDEDIYMWEKWGAESITVDLSNYYTKSEVDLIKYELENKIQDISTLTWNDVN